MAAAIVAFMLVARLIGSRMVARETEAHLLGWRSVIGRVLAKTGTTREASALSGYANKRFAFAVLQNGYPLSYWWARVAQDRFAQVLAGQ